MLTSEIFADLLKQTEGQSVDFKRDGYDLTNEEGRGGFIKDTLSVANTPRSESAYIVLGVKAHADGSKDLVGLEKAVDDNEYQSSLKAKVHPCPTFSYIPVRFEEKLFAVIEVPPERRGPILLVVEGADVQESQAEDLYSILRARQVSVVFLQVLRRFSKVEERERSFYLTSDLSTVESGRFG